MIGDKRVLAIVPARGASKGIPNKNLVSVGGQPLLAWTLEAARGSAHLDRVILSSDSPEICRVAEELGCDVPFLRPPELAQDDTPGIAPVLHALDALAETWDLVVLLQPTSPLRLSSDIDGALQHCIASSAPACVSVCPPASNPYWTFSLGPQGQLQRLLDGDYLRRQDLPAAYALNGAVYVAETSWLRRHKSFLSDETVGFVMPKERSLDLDDPLDLVVLNALLEGDREN